MSIRNLTRRDICTECKQQTHNYYLQRPTNPHYCFEIFKQALLDENAEALECLYEVFLPQVTRWVRDHPRFSYIEEDAAVIAFDALSTFYVAVHGPKFENFPDLPRALQYLKACVNSEIKKYPSINGEPLDPELPIGPPTIPPIDPELFSQAVAKALQEPSLIQLFHWRFILHMKPADILDLPENIYWDEVRAISIALQKIKRRLRKSPEILAFLNDEVEEG